LRAAIYTTPNRFFAEKDIVEELEERDAPSTLTEKRRVLDVTRFPVEFHGELANMEVHEQCI
jgi:hypothetical protein